MQGHYNSVIRGRYEGNYEFNRWFKTPRLRLDYCMMYMSLTHHLEQYAFRNCLELGPGPGTWTRLLYRKNTVAHFDLVDISKEMQEQFALEMRMQPNVSYVVSDFMEFEGNIYDFFFSSRAVEYLEDKGAFLQKLNTLLSDSAYGVIVTKNPQHGFRKKGHVSTQHSGQIAPKECADMLTQNGFIVEGIHPVILRIPFLDRVSLRPVEWLFKSVYKKPLMRSIAPFVESYAVLFRKAV